MITIVSVILALWVGAAIALLVAGGSTRRPDVDRALNSDERIVSGVAWSEFDDVRAGWAADHRHAA